QLIRITNPNPQGFTDVCCRQFIALAVSTGNFSTTAEPLIIKVRVDAVGIGKIWHCLQEFTNAEVPLYLDRSRRRLIWLYHKLCWRAEHGFNSTVTISKTGDNGNRLANLILTHRQGR